MKEQQIVCKDGKIRISIPRGEPIELTPQECWDLSQLTRQFITAHAADLGDSPTQTVSKNGREIRVTLGKYADFWQRMNDGEWEPRTFEIFDRFVSDKTSFLDVGAWIGPTALYAAQRSKRAFAFEPDPVAFKELSANLEANRSSEWASRLTLLNMAVAPASGTVKLGSRAQGGDSESSVLFADRGTSWTVQSTTIDDFLRAHRLDDDQIFVKMDIEGGEYDLIPAIGPFLKQRRVDLFLSIHPSFLMSKLTKGRPAGLAMKIYRRLYAAVSQIRLVRSLPFEYQYHSNGVRLRPMAAGLEALLFGHFLTEIVASHEPWPSEQSR